MIAGIGAVLISIVAALLLVTQFVFDLSIGLLLAAVITLVALVTWYAAPLRRRARVSRMARERSRAH